MWFKQEDGNVVNLENGHTFGVRETRDERLVSTWEIVSTIPVPGVGARVLQKGYASPEDAQEALDAFLSANDISAVGIDDPNAVPADEESADSEETTNRSSRSRTRANR